MPLECSSPTIQWHNQIHTNETKITLQNMVYAKIKISSHVSVGTREWSWGTYMGHEVQLTSINPIKITGSVTQWQ